MWTVHNILIFACDSVKPFSQNYIKYNCLKYIWLLFHNSVLSDQLLFISALLFHIISQPALHSPPLCCVMCDVTGLARDPTYIKGACLLPSACTLFVLPFTICHKLFFVLCSDQGCSITSLYRMSCIKPYTIGKNLGSLLHWHTSKSFTLCCILWHIFHICDLWSNAVCESTCLCLKNELLYSMSEGEIYFESSGFWMLI